MRALLGLITLFACLSFVVPLSTGRWDPDFLRMAEEIALDVSTGSSVEVGAVEAPFVVEQTDGRTQGWRLRGERVEAGAANDPFRHDVVRPRLEVFRAGPGGTLEVATTLTAGRARVELARQGAGRVRVHLREGVALISSGQHLSSESLELWFDPRDPGGAQLRTSDRVTLRSSAARGQLEVVAAGLEGSLRPMRLDLRGPVRFATGTFAQGSLAGSRVEGRAAAGARLIGQLADADRAAPAGEESGPLGMRLPSAIVFRGYDVTYALAGRSTGEGRAARFELTYARAGLGAAAALGGVAGAAPGWRYALASVNASGDVQAWLRRPASKRERALDLRVQGERMHFLGGDLRLEGAPASLREETQGLSLRAPHLSAGLSDPLRLLVQGAGGVSLSLREPPAAPDARRSAGTWTGTLSAARLVLDRAPLAPVSSASSAPVDTSQRALALLQRVERADLSGPIEFARTPGPDRLKLGSLSWERSSGQLRVGGGLAGLIAGVEKGRRAAPWALRAQTASLDLRAGAAPVTSGTEAWLERIERGVLAGDVLVERRPAPPALADPLLQKRALARQARRARGVRGARLELAEGVVTIVGAPRAEVRLGALALRGPQLRYGLRTGRVQGRDVEVELRRGEALYRARAKRGEARLSTDPAAWDADRARRKAARRAGRTLLLPSTIHALSLVGDLRLTGPDELVGSAESLRLEGARARLRGAPVRITDALGRRLVAREVDLMRDDARARTQVSARGGVEVATRLASKVKPGEAPRAPTPLALSGGWLEAEVHDPPGRPKTTTREAWRKQRARALVPLGPFRAGGPQGVSLRLTPPSDAKHAQRVALVAGAVAGRGAQRAGDGTPVVDVTLSGRWAAQLRLPKRGPARIEGQQAQLRLDVTAARGGLTQGEPEETYVRRLLRSLDAKGGVALSAQGLSARAESVTLDAKRGVYVFQGDPAVVRRGGVSQKAQRWVLRLSEE